MDLTLLHDHASRFRIALEHCDRKGWSTLVDFPCGSCGDTTLLLGTYLREQGLGIFDYIWGWRGLGDERRSHAWLTAENVVIDITADQFPEITEQVIVTTAPDWHASWQEVARHVADYRCCNSNVIAQLEPIYRAILVQTKAIG